MKTITAIFFVFLSVFLFAKNSLAFTATGFANPYGVVIDEKTGYIYVSNVNGDPDAKDDNGFISRLKSDGTVDQLRFIDGASPDIILHAPKGMAVLGNYLYVCDLDKIHGYDLTTGKQIFDLNFGDLPREHFYSLTIGPDGALYAADAVKNIIYRIDVSKQHEVTTFIASDELAGPHSILWYPARQVFVVNATVLRQVIAFDKSGKRQQMPAIFLKGLEGLDDDDSGNMYIASRELNSVYLVLPTFALNSFQMGLAGPAGVAYDRAAKSVIVASFNGNAVQSFPVAP
jgi:DNA-binding beta-propeller fold protein YncE